MSGDLISREAAVQMLMEKSYSYVVSLFPTSDECKTAREIAKECAEAVRQMEAVDAEPVRHGRWIGIEYDGYADGYPVYDVFECSECGYEHKGESDTLTSYCPDCGAKMDKEEE